MTNEELDQLIATSVMGLRLIYDEHEDCHIWERDDGSYDWTVDAWHPTRDIAQAFEAVDKLVGQGYEFSIWLNPRNNICQIHKGAPGGDGEDYIADVGNDNLGTAICLAIQSVLESEK